MVGRSQFPAFTVVLENGRQDMEAFFEFAVRVLDGERRVVEGRIGVEESESRSN
jgi:hypothetical protein